MTSEAIEAIVPEEQVDLISGLLWGAGVTAVAEHPDGEGRVLLRTDVPPGGIETARGAIGHLVEVVRLVTVVDDGLDAWRDHAEVVRAGDRIVIRPPWLPLGDVPADAVVVEIDPARSWGHGAHPTTRVCLAELERSLAHRAGSTVLDVGCGSGVLSVTAAMLGAERVVACDVDAVAVAATRDNADRNGVAGTIEVHQVPGLDAAAGGDPLASVGGDRADVVVANIGAGALVELAPHLLARLAPGGTLVLSGLLDEPPAEVLEAFASIDVERVVRLEGWAAVVLRRER